MVIANQYFIAGLGTVTQSNQFTIVCMQMSVNPNPYIDVLTAEHV